MNLDKIMRGLWIVLATIQIASLPAQGQSDANASQAPTSGVAIKLFDPHFSLPQRLVPQDINNNGEIVGSIGDGSALGFFRSKSGEYTEFEFPGQCAEDFSPCTFPNGLNDSGDIVGEARLQSGFQGFLRRKDGSSITLPAGPGNSVALPNGINNQGEIVGTYSIGSENSHGFLLRRGIYTTIDFPGAITTVCRGINNSGLVTGYYIEDTAAGSHGFLWWRGNFIATFQFFASDGARATFSGAINDSGQVSAVYSDPKVLGVFFVRNPDGTITVIDLDTLLRPVKDFQRAIFGMNNRGDLVGPWSSPDGTTYGFLIPRGAGAPR
jgi:hypothetical protein